MKIHLRIIWEGHWPTCINSWAGLLRMNGYLAKGSIEAIPILSNGALLKSAPLAFDVLYHFDCSSFEFDDEGSSCLGLMLSSAWTEVRKFVVAASMAKLSRTSSVHWSVPCRLIRPGFLLYLLACWVTCFLRSFRAEGSRIGVPVCGMKTRPRAKSGSRYSWLWRIHSVRLVRIRDVGLGKYY